MIFKISTVKTIPLRVVAILIFLNGIVNIVFSIFPTRLLKIPDIYNASQIFQYIEYQRASMVLSILIGVFFLVLGVGLYKRQRSAWIWSISLLLFASIENSYPVIRFIPLSLSLSSLLILAIFYRQFLQQKQTLKTHLIIAWMTVLISVLYGGIGCYLMRSQFHGIKSVLDAFYYTLVTYSTVGYGDIIPITAEAKIFVITMIFMGLASFATVISVLLGPILENKLKRVFTMVERLNHLKHHVIFCGVSQLTLQIAKDFKSRQIDVLFVSNSPTDLTEVKQEDFDTLQGDSTDDAVLKKAGIHDAQYCICAEDNDAKNILLTMISNALVSSKPSKEKVKIVTVLNKPSNAENANRVGADKLIIIPQLASEHLLKDIA